MKNVNLGFNKEQIIIIPTVQQIIQQYEAFENELKQNPEVLFVTGSDYVLGVDGGGTWTRSIIILYLYVMIFLKHMVSR